MNYFHQLHSFSSIVSNYIVQCQLIPLEYHQAALHPTLIIFKLKHCFLIVQYLKFIINNYISVTMLISISALSITQIESTSSEFWTFYWHLLILIIRNFLDWIHWTFSLFGFTRQAHPAFPGLSMCVLQCSPLCVLPISWTLFTNQFHA